MQSKWQDVTDDATIHHDSWSCFEKTSQKIQRFQFGNTFYSCDLVKVKYMRSYTAFEKEVQTLTLRRVYSKFHKHVIHAVIERLRPWKKHTIKRERLELHNYIVLRGTTNENCLSHQANRHDHVDRPQKREKLDHRWKCYKRLRLRRCGGCGCGCGGSMLCNRNQLHKDEIFLSE